MAVVGHFESLAEARKLVQSTMIAGVIQETYEDGQLLKMLPVTVIDSRSLIYNRESTLPSAAFYDIHEQIPWTADVNFTQVEVWLKRIARQDILDKFMLKTYRNPNDYRTEILRALRKGVMRTIEDKLLYGSGSTEASSEFNGLDKLITVADGDAFTSATAAQAYDMGGASTPLSLKVFRELIDVVRPKPSILLMTRTMRNTLSATAFEKGLILASTSTMASISYSKDEFGARVDYFDGIPIVISDYLLDENDNTGAKDSGNDSGISSIYAIRFGAIADGGLSLVVGGDTGGAEFFNVVELDDLEDYDAGGIRLVAYVTLALGSTKALGRIHSIDEDGVIVG